jgi:hypothetical protein
LPRGLQREWLAAMLRRHGATTRSDGGNAGGSGMGRQRTVSRIAAPALGVVLAFSMVSAASAGQRGVTHDDHATSPPGLAAEAGALNGIAATRGGAWAVGYSGNGSDSKALTLYWNGTRWQPEPSPSPPDAVLHSVAATSPTNVWAVGSSGTYPAPSRTLILHRTGKKWKQMPSIPGSLSAVASTSPTNAWAVGSTNNNDALILHWNGKEWQQTPSPAGIFSGVAAMSPTNAWVVGGTTSGDTLVLHWNGKTWQQTPSPSVGGGQGLSSFLIGVDASPDRPVWAVGDGDSCGCGPGDPLVEQWNGKTWSQLSTSKLQGGIDVSAAVSLSSSRGWAVGQSGSGDGPTNGVILEWNGSAWIHEPVPGLEADEGKLSDVAATSRSNAWAVGWESPVSTAGPAGPGDTGTPEILILHWNGSAWTPQTTLRPAKTPAAAVATTTTTTTSSTTTSSTTTTNVAPSTSPTSVVSGFTQWSGAWGAHEQQLEISPTGDGTLSYQDLTACPNCSFASAPTATMEFMLTSVNGGTASGTVTASSDSTNYAVGQEVMVSLAAGSPGQLLELSVAGQGPVTYCNSTSAGQCGA